MSMTLLGVLLWFVCLLNGYFAVVGLSSVDSLDRKTGAFNAFVAVFDFIVLIALVYRL